MTPFIPHPEIFRSPLALLSRRGCCSEAWGGSGRVSSFTVPLAASLLRWKRVAPDGLSQEATLRRELIINTSRLVGRTSELQEVWLLPADVRNVKLLQQLAGWFL